VNDVELSVLPLEARRYQGTAAGIATRLAASTMDGLLVGGTLLVGYAGYVGVRLVVSPRSFRPPDPTLTVVVYVFLAAVVVYLTTAWWISGSTFGNHVMGLQVVNRDAGRVGLTRAFARAALCAAFPLGLLWCVVDPRRRSLQDLALRTSVVYNWLPRAAGVPADRRSM
jgi:uncharacterized RDD family membrane protein YckC